MSSQYVALPNFKTKTPLGPVELKGQLELGTLYMDAPELIDLNDVISGRLNFRDNPSSFSDTILDASCMTNGALRWLEISRGTVWCLAIVTTDEAALSEAVKWPTCSSGTTDSVSNFDCILGLILIPTIEFLDSMHESVRVLERDLDTFNPLDDWYLTKTPTSFRRVGVYKSRKHPPPSAHITTVVLA